VYAYSKMPTPPAPSNPEEAMRWEHTRHRRALMEGRWQRLLEDRLQTQLGSTRRQAWGLPDMGTNAYRQVCYSLACLYDAEPDVKHNRAGDVSALTDMISRSGLWPQMSRFQAMTIALREMWMRIDVEDGRIIYRPVAPDMTIAESDPSRPTIPTAYAEVRLRHVRGETVWAWDVLDIRDPANPSYTVRLATDDAKFGEDVTEEVLGARFDGAAYPYRRTPRGDEVLGAPILPVVLYHASLYGDRLFDPFFGVETYEASLNQSVFSTFLAHSIRDASFPQRYAIGVRIAGSDMVDGGTRGQRVEVVTDPTTILMLDAAMEQQPQVGQFTAGSDVSTLEQTIAALAHRLATDAGLSPSELQRTSGSAKSGYAISLSNEGRREAQRKYIPQQREGDERLLAVTATLLNRAMGTQFPEGGYSILYREIPLSPEELSSRRQHVLEMLEAGLMRRVDALRYFGSLSEEDARAALEAIDAEKAPTAAEQESEGTGPAPAEQVSTETEHGEEMADAAEEVVASAEAIRALLAGDVPAATRRVLEAVAESLAEAAGYLGAGPMVEAEVEISDEEDDAMPETETPDTAAPEESVAAAATSAGVPASAVALNGAQVQAAQGIITSVAKGELPRGTGVQMLVQFFNMAPEAAEALMGDVGGSFTITAPEAP